MSTEPNVMITISNPAAQLVLPLREDIQLQATSPARDGSPQWHLYDPVRNRFFRIGWLEFELIRRWQSGVSINTLCQQVNQQTPLSVHEEDVEALVLFLQKNELLYCHASAQRGFLQQLAQSRKQNIAQWLLHNYLFIRIPLVKPDAWLGRNLPYIHWVFHPYFFVFIALLTAIGCVQTANQWSAFSATFLYFFSWQGLFWYGLALALTKTVHELGHAFVAKRFGLRVPTMGIAFMLLMPLLYTDTSEGWKLCEHRKRVLIDSAGIIAELCLAGLALFAWCFLPEGPLKSAAYILATVTWVSALFINLNPFMRFDGYYLLMDAVNIPNLQHRSFEVGRWQLRKTLLGWQAEYPEQEHQRWHRFLLLYAYSTWLYRLVLFTAIAAAVYYFFFKLLGILLFLVEIGWFIVLPIYQEVLQWWKSRGQWQHKRRYWLTLGLIAVIFTLLLLPLQNEIKAFGYWQAGQHTRLYPPSSSQLLEVHVKEGEQVKAGQVLFKLGSPEYDWQLQAADSKTVGVNQQLSGALANEQLFEHTRVLQQELSAAQTASAAMQAEQARLQITAPHDGVIRDLALGLDRGSWLAPQQLLANLTVPTQSVAQIFVSEADIQHIKIGARATIFTDRADVERMTATVSNIDPISSLVLEEPFLASDFGGPIATRRDEQGKLIPNEALYRVTLRCDTPLHTQQVTPVVTFIEGDAHSILWNGIRYSLAVLIREVGF